MPFDPAADQTRYRVCLPPAGSRAHALIRPGSGIVASPAKTQDGLADGEQLWKVDYEGDVYASESLRVYGSRVAHAHDRAVSNYPTVARAALPGHTLIDIGYFDSYAGVVVLHEPRPLEPANLTVKTATGAGPHPEAVALLADWLKIAASDVAEQLHAHGATFQTRRDHAELSASSDPTKQAQAAFLARRYARHLRP